MEMKIDQLAEDADNSRTHSDEQIQGIADSLHEFGFINPVVIDENDMIMAGHGRVKAAENIGYESVPVVKADHLTHEQKRAYVIADNKLALSSGWDDEILKEELSIIDASEVDVNVTDFSSDQIQKILGQVDFEPEYEPNFSTRDVTPDDLEKKQEDLSGRYERQEPGREVICPDCGHEFRSD